MTKKNLLTAVATVALLATAGTASAHDLIFRAAAAPLTDIDAGDVGPTGYRLAEEAIGTTSGVFALAANLSGGSSFPSGNNFIQIDLNGGTFTTALTSSTVTAAGCTVVLSSGGGAGSTTASFLVSSSGASCNASSLDLPITPNAGADVWARTTISTEAGSPIDPANPQVQPAGNPFGNLNANQEALQLVDRVNAFRVAIDGAIGAGALNDTFATLTVTPVYTTFFVGAAGHNAVSETSTAGQLGTVQIVVDTTAFRDLAKNAVVAGDVTDADVTVTGAFGAFDGAGGSATLGGVNYDALAANVATYNNRQAALTAAAQPYRVLRETAATPIPTSSYVASVAYTLNATFYTQEGPVGGSLETIGRDGTNIILPWMNSSSLQASNGSTNLVRLGNVGGSAAGPVFAQVLNSTTGVAGAPVQLFPSIAVGGERVITTAILTTNLGEFGRGDIQISVEAPANTITARRYATLANGSVTELSNGTVASEQTPADPNDVP